MNQAVFISDLHLHPDMPEISERFMRFLSWAKTNTTSIYILGDFFHVWIGDDGIGSFEHQIASALQELTQAGMDIFWLPGNRDFLIGAQFLKMCGVKHLPDPSVIALPGMRVMIAHGDAYCLYDYGHQLLRLLTRSTWKRRLLLALPKKLRRLLILAVRQKSQMKAASRPQNHKKYSIRSHIRLFLYFYHLNYLSNYYRNILEIKRSLFK